MTAGMSKSAGTAAGGFEVIDDVESGLDDGDDDQLCDAVPDVDGETFIAATPAGDEQLALVIRIDQSDQVAQHDAVFVTQA